MRQITFRSERVTAGTRDYEDAKTLAQRHADSQGGRVEWQDEYNDYSVRGIWVAVS